MKVSVFEVEEWEKAAFKRLDAGAEVAFSPEPLSLRNAAGHADAEVISTFIYSELTSAVLKNLKKLRLIATRSTGYDHINTVYCEKKGITVSNVPVYGDNTVAEHVFGLILAISHHIVESVNRARRGNFSLRSIRGFDLLGKRLGVIGTGNIGRHVLEIARGFHMEPVAFDLKPDEGLAARLGFRYTTLDDLLSTSDIITLHIPVTPGTFNFLSAPQFEMMKDGVIIINTARGTLIDIQALLVAIRKGKVAAAGLDVLPEEPVIREEAELLRSIAERKHLETLLADALLLRLDNVIITPHNAFNTREAVGRILETTIDNISAFMGGEPRNVVSGNGGARRKTG